jgi:UPF0042 nucleotide-binding protein
VHPLHLIIISGLSGSGKTHAIKCFEDLGFFCVDNLPSALLETFAELCVQRGGEYQRIALGIDIRERGFLDEFSGGLERLKSIGHFVELVFFEARDDVLARRFSESRRPHPLALQGHVMDGIREERERIRLLRDRADRIIDTSALSVHQLKDLLASQYTDSGTGRRMVVTLMTFGFKYGVPYDIDLLFDVRFLRNPNFVAELKPLTGEDPRVHAHVFGDPNGPPLLHHLHGLMHFLLPLYERERRSYLTVAIGCTGGRHRSVSVAIALKNKLAETGHSVSVRHRDLVRV